MNISFSSVEFYFFLTLFISYWTSRTVSNSGSPSVGLGTG